MTATILPFRARESLADHNARLTTQIAATPFPVPTAPSKPLSWVYLLRMDGTPFQEAGFNGTEGPSAAWEWVVETVAEYLDCSPEKIGCTDGNDASDGQDLVTLDGLPVFMLRIGNLRASPLFS